MPQKASDATSRADRLSLAAFVVVMVLTNVWFFSQALPYANPF